MTDRLKRHSFLYVVPGNHAFPKSNSHAQWTDLTSVHLNCESCTASWPAVYLLNLVSKHQVLQQHYFVGHFSFSGKQDKPTQLHLQVLGGRAFVGELASEDSEKSTSVLTLHVVFRGQRYASKPVACSCEPAIRHNFVIPLPTSPVPVESNGHDHGLMGVAREESTTTANLLAISEPIHLLLVKEHSRTREKTLLSSHYLEWRKVGQFILSS